VRAIRSRVRETTAASRLAIASMTATSVRAPAGRGSISLEPATVSDWPSGAGDGAFGDLVGEVAPRVDELIEEQVDRPELAALDVPVRLLADQRQLGEVDEHALKVSGDGAVVAVVRNMEIVCGG
jgi:hypothetical protein